MTIELPPTSGSRMQRVVLAYDGSAAAQQILLQSEALHPWHDAVFILVAALQSSSAPDAHTDERVPDFPEAEAAERAHVRFVLERGAEALRARGWRVDALLVQGACVDEIVSIARNEGAVVTALVHRPQVPWAQQWWQTMVVRGLVDRAPGNLILVGPH